MKIPFSSLIWQQHTRLWVNGLTCNSKGKTLVKNTNGWTWISFGLRREVKRLISLKNCFTILIFSSKWISDHLGWDSTKNHYKWLDSSISGTTTSKHISWLQLSVLPTIYFLPILQGDPNQNLLIQMATTLKICIFDPMFVKPKWVSEASIYFWKL